jgi:hypothetical protein
MPCLLGLLALITPRIVIILVLIFSNYLESAYQTLLWPLLGFLFMPLTTLAYAFAINEHGSLSGLYLALFVVAVLIDFGSLGGGAASGRRGR